MIEAIDCPMVTLRSKGPRYSLMDITKAFPPKQKNQRIKKFTERNSITAIDQVEFTGEQQLIVARTVSAMKADHPVLWEGTFDKFGARRGGGSYESQSDADLAMAGYIAKNLAENVASPEEMILLTEAVMNQSGLAQRTKWQDREDYPLNTITKACADVEVQPLVDWSLSGDVRNAKAFARMNRGKFLYVYKIKRWLIWRDERWQWCEQEEPLDAAKQVANTLVKLAADQLTDDPDRGRRLIAEATKASLLPRLKAMLELATSEPGMGVTPERLDAKPEMLGVQNGVVNLRMGWLQPNDPSMLVTQHCAADYKKAADCPRWEQFLDEVYERDMATIGAVQVLLGLTLTGEVREEVIIFSVGFGANGKSIFSNVISRILGTYAKTAPPSLLASRRNDDHGPRPDMAMLKGSRLVSINELPGGMQLDEVAAKQLAGREPIAARHLYGDFFSFVPSFTPWVRTNHKPIVKGDDDGVWRRIIILPFRRKFEKHEQDPFLEATLMAESEGILAWMIEGARKYYRDGLRLSPAMKREMAQYRKESDMLGEFLEECTMPAHGGRVEQVDLFCKWTFWCDQNGVKPTSKKTFTQRLAERGYSEARSNGKRFYSGLSLKKALFS